MLSEELLRVEDQKKAVYCSYLDYSIISDSSVYAYSIRAFRLKRTSEEEEQEEEKPVCVAP